MGFFIHFIWPTLCFVRISLLKIPKNNEKVNFSWKYSIFFFFICKYKGPVYVSIVRGGSTMAHEIFGTNSSFPVK